MSDIDPYCLHHGKRRSEHEGGRCLYCCICFKTLTPEECRALDLVQDRDEFDRQVAALREAA